MSAKIDRSDARRGQGAIGFRNRLADLQARVAKKLGATKTHAAPGRLGYLASKLIEKGQRQLADCRTSIDFLKVAILALRARYLLCGQTPTLNLQAIALQHRAEAKAECMFLGVEDSADIEMRIEEIKCEVAEICTKYGDEKGMRISYHSSLIEILTDLHKVYEEHGRFEEKLACANAIRIEKTRILWVNPGWKVLYLWIRSYFVHLVASPKLFGVMLAISFAFAFLLFGLNDHTVRIFYLDNPPSINFDFASRLFQFVLFSKTDGFDKEPLFLEGWPLFVGRVLLPAFWWIHLGAFLALLTSRVTRN